MSFTALFLIALVSVIVLFCIGLTQFDRYPRITGAFFVVIGLTFSGLTTTLIIKDVRATTLEACGK